MIKLIGAVFVIFAGTMLGFYQALQLSSRPRQIRQSIQALQRLETEISYGYTPLPDALSAVAAAAGGPVSDLFAEAAKGLQEDGMESVRASWARAVERIWGHTSMKRTEQEAILSLGSVLGISGREDQTKHLRLAVNILQAEEEAAAEDYRRFGKMWRSLGMLAGVLIVILMY